ncbi:MAG TPA: choice-of-anchor B family protein [Gemmatimonadales bacterium]
MVHRTLSLLAVTAVLAFSGLAAQGAFGSALAVSGRDVFVGQPGNAYGPGVVYIFRANTQGAWRAAQKVTRADAVNGDGFGSAIAVDGNTMLVGAGTADSNAGIVYVLTKGANGAWRESGTLKADDRHAGDRFGTGIVVVDGRAYISTGIEGFGSMVFSRKGGAVFVFRNNNGTWTQEATLSSTDTSNAQTFGGAVAVSGSRVMVGNFRADSGNGAVYVFSRDGSGAYKMESKIVPPGPITGRNSGFGSSLVLRGDTALIGAINDRGAGAVWIFARDSAAGRWNPVTRTLPFDGSFGTRYGIALAELGNELWIGADGANGFAGGVYRVTRDSSGFPSALKLTAPTSVAAGNNQFGSKIAAAGSLVAVTVENEDFGEGGVVVYSRRSAGTWGVAAHLVGDVSRLTAITGANRECTNGKIQNFDCNQVDLLSFLPVSALGGKRGVQMNDVWGYSDPQTGHDYVLAGRFDGTAFVDVTDPSRPVYLGSLPKTAGSPGNFWRDIKTYKHYAFIVADGAREHGMQVFDLNRLRDVKGAPVTFTEDAHYSNIHSAHNIVSDTATGFMYIVGASGGGEMCGGGLHMVDVRDPLHPKFAGCFSDPATGRQGTGYSHDAQCVVYHGPSTKYQGREICFGFNETAIDIADVTDKTHPVAISHATYPNVAYAHQGWLTDDQRYVYEDDELDEIEGFVDGTRTLIWDVNDLDNPVLAGQYISKNRSTDHNLFVNGNTIYQSNYVSGLRVLDITDRVHPVQVGFFDTHPVGPDEPGFAGSWGNYPFFKSGIVAVTSMQEGLFILKKHPTPPVP